MSEFLNDSQVIERILNHVSNGTTDRAETIWEEPVANYVSETRLARELDVFRTLPMAFCPSAALAEKGAYIARPVAGVPLIVVRGQDGTVRAFKNACRHRGTQLVNGEGCTRAFVCPYHGWAYRLDGQLQSVPHEDGFPGLDKSSLGLMEVGVEDNRGMIFVTLDPAHAEKGVLDTLPKLLGDDQQFMGSSDAIIEANWKVYIESFIEGYHIKYAHPETFYPYGYDNLNVIEHSGLHSRVTYPFKRIEKLANVPSQERRIDGKVTYVYHLFPNVLVTVLSRHTNIVIAEPFGLDRTKTYTYRLTNSGGGEDALELAKRDSSFVADTGVQEDIALVEGIQRSIHSGANEAFTFGHFEGAIQHFHRNLTAHVDRRPE